MSFRVLQYNILNPNHMHVGESQPSWYSNQFKFITNQQTRSSGPKRIENIFLNIMSVRPDIVTLQECCDIYSKDLTNRFRGEGYTLDYERHADCDDGVVIGYRSDRFFVASRSKSKVFGKRNLSLDLLDKMNQTMVRITTGHIYFPQAYDHIANLIDLSEYTKPTIVPSIRIIAGDMNICDKPRKGGPLGTIEDPYTHEARSLAQFPTQHYTSTASGAYTDWLCEKEIDYIYMLQTNAQYSSTPITVTLTPDQIQASDHLPICVEFNPLVSFERVILNPDMAHLIKEIEIPHTPHPDPDGPMQDPLWSWPYQRPRFISPTCRLPKGSIAQEIYELCDHLQPTKDVTDHSLFILLESLQGILLRQGTTTYDHQKVKEAFSSQNMSLLDFGGGTKMLICIDNAYKRYQKKLSRADSAPHVSLPPPPPSSSSPRVPQPHDFALPDLFVSPSSPSLPLTDDQLAIAKQQVNGLLSTEAQAIYEKFICPRNMGLGEAIVVCQLLDGLLKISYPAKKATEIVLEFGKGLQETIAQGHIADCEQALSVAFTPASPLSSVQATLSRPPSLTPVQPMPPVAKIAKRSTTQIALTIASLIGALGCLGIGFYTPVNSISPFLQPAYGFAILWLAISYIVQRPKKDPLLPNI